MKVEDMTPGTCPLPLHGAYRSPPGMGCPLCIEAVELKCDPDTHCAVCMVPLIPEHAHMRCPKCGQRDSCCF